MNGAASFCFIVDVIVFFWLMKDIVFVEGFNVESVMDLVGVFCCFFACVEDFLPLVCMADFIGFGLVLFDVFADVFLV